MDGLWILADIGIRKEKQIVSSLEAKKKKNLNWEQVFRKGNPRPDLVSSRCVTIHSYS